MPAPEWWPRRSRLRDFEVLRFGTAMTSSSVVRNRALARSRVQVSPAAGAEPGALGLAERIGRHRQRQLFAHELNKVDVSGRRRELVHRGIILKIGVTGEHEPDIRIDRQSHVGQAAAALRLHLPANVALPEVTACRAGLNPAFHLHRRDEGQLQSLEYRISLGERPAGGHWPVFQIPEIDPKHSPGS